jgi:hypothetical protein
LLGLGQTKKLSAKTSFDNLVLHIAGTCQTIAKERRCFGVQTEADLIVRRSYARISAGELPALLKGSCTTQHTVSLLFQAGQAEAFQTLKTPA